MPLWCFSGDSGGGHGPAAARENGPRVRKGFGRANPEGTTRDSGHVHVCKKEAARDAFWSGPRGAGPKPCLGRAPTGNMVAEVEVLLDGLATKESFVSRRLDCCC